MHLWKAYKMPRLFFVNSFRCCWAHFLSDTGVVLLMQARLSKYRPRFTWKYICHAIECQICDDDMCPQCLAEKHSLDHKFLRCQLTLFFWDIFQTWWTSKTKDNVTLTESMILYRIFVNREHLYSSNYSLLIAKYSICSSCLQEKKLCFDSFLTFLSEKINIHVQREIAVQNNNITKLKTIYRSLL